MIFILGAGGFVGSAFVRYCETRGLAHAAITRSNYDEYVSRDCSLLINAGGNSSKHLPLTDPLADFDKNARDTLRSLLDFRSETYVLLSSIDVYNELSLPSENTELAAIVPERLSRYGVSKYIAEILVRQYASRFFVFRLGGMVGPGLRKNAIYDLTHGGRLFVHPDSAYQYLHVDWTAEIVMRLVEAQAPGQTTNVCGDGALPLTAVCDWLGLTASASEFRVDHYHINIDKLKAALAVPTSAESVQRYLSEINVAHDDGTDPAEKQSAV